MSNIQFFNICFVNDEILSSYIIVEYCHELILFLSLKVIDRLGPIYIISRLLTIFKRRSLVFVPNGVNSRIQPKVSNSLAKPKDLSSCV